MQKGIKHTIKTNSAYYLTLTVVDWVDVFMRKNHRDAVIESFKVQLAGLQIQRSRENSRVSIFLTPYRRMFSANSFSKFIIMPFSLI